MLLDTTRCGAPTEHNMTNAETTAIAAAEAAVINAGHKVLYSHITAYGYASAYSVASAPNTYGHPVFEITVKVGD
jgi:hypothetical protein